jgi:hypothetical protein
MLRYTGQEHEVTGFLPQPQRGFGVFGYSRRDAIAGADILPPYGSVRQTPYILPGTPFADQPGTYREVFRQPGDKTHTPHEIKVLPGG